MQQATMERRIINPWTWQEAFGFVQANAVDGSRRLVFCAGQFAGDAGGRPMHGGDFRAQLHRALDNVERVLAEAGLGLGSVVRLTYYTTDVDAFLANVGSLAARLRAAGCRPASTLLGVARLASPELMIEIEATAAS
jgi:enamine deaminase RidA (YjgF/YER057c/UK114 family)